MGKRKEKKEEERKMRKMMEKYLLKMCQEYEYRSHHWYFRIGETWVISIISIFFLPKCKPRTASQTVLHKWGGDWGMFSLSGTSRKLWCYPSSPLGLLPSSPGIRSCLLGLLLHEVGLLWHPPRKEWQHALLICKDRSICVMSEGLSPMGEHYFCCHWYVL